MTADVATALATLRALRERIEAHLADRPSTPKAAKVDVPIGPVRNGTTLEDRVLAQLRKRPQSKPQLARGLMENTRDVEQVIAALHGQGRVRSAGELTGYETYSLVEEM